MSGAYRSRGQRTIYVSDDDLWARAVEEARRRGMSVSALIRVLLERETDGQADITPRRGS
jgi:predicted DNA-binding ribbon-helix-helix protein